MPEIPSTTVDQIGQSVPPMQPILDVREQDEWDAGHIDGAVHVPLSELGSRMGDVPQVEPLLVTCKAGGRSAQAVEHLRSQGVEAINLDGGMLAWEQAGRPMTTENGAAPRVV